MPEKHFTLIVLRIASTNEIELLHDILNLQGVVIAIKERKHVLYRIVGRLPLSKALSNMLLCPAAATKPCEMIYTRQLMLHHC